MKKYNVLCPFCGCLNLGLLLDETDDLMECICCKIVHRVSSEDKIPARIQYHAVKG